MTRRSAMSPDHGWDLISIILGGAVAIALMVLGVPIAKAVQNKLRDGISATHAGGAAQ